MSTLAPAKYGDLKAGPGVCQASTPEESGNCPEKATLGIKMFVSVDGGVRPVKIRVCDRHGALTREHQSEHIVKIWSLREGE